MRITALLGLAAALLPLTAGAAPSGRGPKIGVQLYSVRDDCANDLPAVIKGVAAMGYQGVEFAGYYGRSAEELRRMLDEAGLVCCGTHTSLDSLTGDNLAATIAFNKTLGNRYLIVPGLPHERTATREAWLETARIFNEIAKKVKPHGMVVGYHNHTEEFKPLGGELPWDTFFGNTTKDVVMQFDTGNALVGGAEAAPFIKRYPGRATTAHIKEHSATNPNALIGEGDIQWKELLPLIKNTGKAKWYIVEQESGSFPPMECIRRCIVNLKQILGQK